MAKAPKAPGSNGSATLSDLVQALTARADVRGPSDYWTAQIISTAAGPIAALAGEAEARALLPRTVVVPGLASVTLGRIAVGLARRGEPAAARAAVDEAASLVERDAVDGESGTLAWCAIARARHALGDAVGADRALDAAELCASREKSNPTQPWPHLAVALADLGRLARLAARLSATPTDYISFATEEAAVRGITSAVAAGDVEAFRALFAPLAGEKRHLGIRGIGGGAAGALKAGHGASLPRVLEAYGEGSYTAYLAADLAIAAAAHGDAALALALTGWCPATGHCAGDAAEALATLGDEAEVRRLTREHGSDRTHARRMALALARIGDVPEALGFLAEGAGGEEYGRWLGRAVQALAGRDVSAAATLAAGGVAHARTMEEQYACVALCEAGLALRDAGRADLGRPLIDESVTMADGVKKADQGWSRNNALKGVGIRLAGAGEWAGALLALRRCTSKYFKPHIASALAQTYVRAGDVAGAVLTLAMVPVDSPKGLMNVCDALSVLAGDAPFYENYA